MTIYKIVFMRIDQILIIIFINGLSCKYTVTDLHGVMILDLYYNDTFVICNDNFKIKFFLIYNMICALWRSIWLLIL